MEKWFDSLDAEVDGLDFGDMFNQIEDCLSEVGSEHGSEHQALAAHLLDMVFSFYFHLGASPLAAFWYSLGACYFDGRHVERNATMAVRLFKRIAQEPGGDPFFCGDDEERVLKKPQIDSCLALGRCYQYGYGVQEDAQLSFQWNSAAAPFNDDAKRRVAYCYRIGYGVQRNMTSAIKLYEQLAKGNDGEACFYLGAFYCSGDGSDVDVWRFWWYLMNAAKESFVPQPDHLSLISSEHQPKILLVLVFGYCFLESSEAEACKSEVMEIPIKVKASGDADTVAEVESPEEWMTEEEIRECMASEEFLVAVMVCRALQLESKNWVVPTEWLEVMVEFEYNPDPEDFSAIISQSCSSLDVKIRQEHLSWALFELGRAYHHARNETAAFALYKKAATKSEFNQHPRFGAIALVAKCYHEGIGTTKNFFQRDEWLSIAVKRISDVDDEEEELRFFAFMLYAENHETGPWSFKSWEIYDKMQQMFAMENDREYYGRLELSVRSRKVRMLFEENAPGIQEQKNEAIREMKDILYRHNYIPGRYEFGPSLEGIVGFMVKEDQDLLPLAYAVGLWHYYGTEGFDKSLEMSTKWLTIAAAGPLLPAKYAMAFFYFHGKGVGKDLSRAKKLLEECVELSMSPEYCIGEDYYELGFVYETDSRWWSGFMDYWEGAERSRDRMPYFPALLLLGRCYFETKSLESEGPMALFQQLAGKMQETGWDEYRDERVVEMCKKLGSATSCKDLFDRLVPYGENRPAFEAAMWSTLGVAVGIKKNDFALNDSIAPYYRALGLLYRECFEAESIDALGVEDVFQHIVGMTEVVDARALGSFGLSMHNVLLGSSRGKEGGDYAEILEVFAKEGSLDCIYCCIRNFWWLLPPLVATTKRRLYAPAEKLSIKAAQTEMLTESAKAAQTALPAVYQTTQWKKRPADQHKSQKESAGVVAVTDRSIKKKRQHKAKLKD